ncbi:MAG: SDR family NAD(P)-dependent oxidoreductase, partial [Streptosporangiaceae bacterium]
ATAWRDTQFWDAVERADLAALTLALDSPADQDQVLGAALPTLSAWRRRHRDQAELDDWRYQTAWKPLPEAGAPVLAGTWLVFVPETHTDHPVVGTVVRALSEHGAVPHLQPVDTATVSRDSLAGLVSGTEPAGVLSLLSLAEDAFPGHCGLPAGLAATTALVQSLADITAPLWCVTQGAVSVSPADPLTSPLQAQTWGLGRVAALELPQRWGGLIDLPADLDHHTATRLAALLVSGQPEDQVAIRTAAALGRRMRRAAGSPAPHPAWQPTGTTLITGGTGGLGAQVARSLAGRGAPHLLLVSRQGPDTPGVGQLATELRDSGTAVTVVSCDVSDRPALQGVIDGVPAEHPLTAVVHAAGIPEATPLADVDFAHLDQVLLPKAHAAAHLHELTRNLDLSAFVLFSSGAAAWGSGRQASYAAANAYLDALAEHRRGLGLAATSLAWGPWAEAGMAADEAAVAYYERRGLTPLDPGLAIRSLHHALDRRDTTVTIAEIDWARFPAGFTAQRPSPFLSELAPPDRRDAKPESEAVHPLRQQLAGSPAAQQLHLLLRLVQDSAATVLGHSGPDAIGSGRPFQDLGFDSLTGVELRNRVGSATGLSLPPTLVFDHPTPHALAAYLRAELTGSQEDRPARAPAAAAHDEPIAIVGMACRFPGEADNPQRLWDLVTAGQDAIAGMPGNRHWDLNTLFDPDPDHPGTSYVREGGFLHDAAEFDAACFGISPREALAMDPQQRILLETAWEAFEDAGLSREALHGSSTGVFTGVTSQDYLSLTSQTSSDIEGYIATGNIGSVVSGRVSYTFGLEGPAVTVDTACSSSLVATHLAAQALRQGECSLALAGGVTIMATPGAFVEFSRQRGMAADARCKPFAAAADGLVWGEGAGLLLLERLSDAQRHGHRVLAVIRGSAVNQDGASNGLTAPNGPSQQRV